MNSPNDLLSIQELDPSTISFPQNKFYLEDGLLVRELVTESRSYRSSVPLRLDGVGIEDDLSGLWWWAYLKGEQPVASTGAEVMPLRFAELFSGPGGLALGFSQACAELGIEPLSMAAADQDADALAVYQRRNKTRYTTTESVSMLVDYEVLGEGDSARFTYAPEPIDDNWAALSGGLDVLLAGPPCQGHSNLNNKTRRDDWRNELYLTAPAMAIALNVPVVIIENVRAVLHDRHQVVQSSVALLRNAGYLVEAGVLKAADMGWPQSRERYFLVARRDKAPLALNQVSALLESEPRSIWWAIHDLEFPDPDDFMSRAPEFSEENIRRINYLHDNGLFDLPKEERPDCHRDGTTYNAVYGRLYIDRPAPTITTGFMTPGRGRYIHPTQRRVLTAREAARLQGFPDDYDFRPNRATIPAKASLAKWIGDAVPMPLGYAASMAALLSGELR